jgi:hypothetical protein
MGEIGNLFRRPWVLENEPKSFKTAESSLTLASTITSYPEKYTIQDFLILLRTGLFDSDLCFLNGRGTLIDEELNISSEQPLN